MVGSTPLVVDALGSVFSHPVVHAVVGIALGTYLGLKVLAIYLERTQS